MIYIKAIGRVWAAAILVILIVAASVAHAAPHAYTVTAWLQGDYHSEPGEDKLAFVARVAKELQAWTNETGWEACGPLAKMPDGSFVVQLTTNKAQTLCLRSTSAPAGATLIGESLHSHPTAPNGIVKFTDMDRAAHKALHDWKFADRSVKSVIVEQDHFSPDDFNEGPGYLAVNGRLLYQHGPGTEVEISGRADLAQVTP